MPTQEEYPKGGYECGVCWAADRDPVTGAKMGVTKVEGEYRAAIKALVGGGGGGGASRL